LTNELTDSKFALESFLTLIDSIATTGPKNRGAREHDFHYALEFNELELSENCPRRKRKRKDTNDEKFYTKTEKLRSRDVEYLVIKEL
jgi:hypothetical protein